MHVYQKLRISNFSGRMVYFYIETLHVKSSVRVNLSGYYYDFYF